jgi:hypothetical protein
MGLDTKTVGRDVTLHAISSWRNFVLSYGISVIVKLQYFYFCYRLRVRLSNLFLKEQCVKEGVPRITRILT